MERRRLAGGILVEVVSLTQTRYEDAPAANSKKHNAPAKCLSEMLYRSADDPVVNSEHLALQMSRYALARCGYKCVHLRPSIEVQGVVYGTSLVHMALQSGPISIYPVPNIDHRLGQNIRMCATALP